MTPKPKNPQEIRLIERSFIFASLIEVWKMFKLDIGCGSNKREGYFGLDIGRSKGVDIVASVTNLPFRDSSVDEVFTRRCIQHVKDHENSTGEIYRVLKYGLIAEIIVASYRGWLYYRIKNIRRKSYSSFHLYTNRSLATILRKAGFYVVEVRHVKTRKLGYDISVIVKKK